MDLMLFNTWNLQIKKTEKEEKNLKSQSFENNQILVEKKEQPWKMIVKATKKQCEFIENKCKIHAPKEQQWRKYLPRMLFSQQGVCLVVAMLQLAAAVL